jgi:hypothetical protein
MPKKPAIVTGPLPGGGWQNKRQNKTEGNQRASHITPDEGRGPSEGQRDGPSGCTPSTRSRTARVGSPNAIRTAATRSRRGGKRARQVTLPDR